MYTPYNNYWVRLDNGVELTYQLESHSVAQRWAHKIASIDSSYIHPSYNAMRGMGGRSLTALLLELDSLINSLNQWIPDPIVDRVDITQLNASLNRLHIHFPELEASESDSLRLAQLYRYNNIIHEIQYTIKPSPYILMCYSHVDHEPLLESDYSLFRSSWTAGSLLLHYAQVGRHPLELMLSRDLECPQDQIRPQTLLSSSHTMRFFSCPVRSADFAGFYSTSGYLWPYAVEDPRLAVGYIPLGKIMGAVPMDRLRQARAVVDFKVY